MSLGRPKAALELTAGEQQELAGFAASRSLAHAQERMFACGYCSSAENVRVPCRYENWDWEGIVRSKRSMSIRLVGCFTAGIPAGLASSPFPENSYNFGYDLAGRGPPRKMRGAALLCCHILKGVNSEPLFKNHQAEEDFVVVILTGLVLPKDPLDCRWLQILIQQRSRIQ